MREVRSQIKRRAGDRPENEHRLALRGSDAVLVAVAQLKRVEVVPAPRLGVAVPFVHVLKAIDNARRPVSQLALTAGSVLRPQA